MDSISQPALPTLPFAKLSFLASTPVLVAVLVLFTLCYLAVSAVLVYHWNTYGMGRRGILVAEALYIMISAVLFVMASLGVHYF